jgi:single-stranded DNA-specific DHH superfamily exonuclease
MSEDFEVIGAIEDIQPIARGSRIREIARLRKAFGTGRLRKLNQRA